MTVDRYMACAACDLLHRRSELRPGTSARCARCGTLLYRNRPMSPDRPLALVIAGLILFHIANLYPFLTLEIEGRTQETVLLTGILELYFQGQLGLAALVLATGWICPFLQLLGLTYVLLPLRLGSVPPYMATVYRWVRHFQPWSMMEIFLLGMLVSIVKLSDMASVVPGLALYAFMLLIFLLPAATVGIDSKSIWALSPIQANR